jgi:hypothetical protein
VHGTAAFIVAFDPNGGPLDAKAINGDLQNIEMFVDRSRDRILVTSALESPVDFGGGEVTPEPGHRLALAKLGIRRPPQVTFKSLDATRANSDVTVSWDLASGEALAGYTLARRTDHSAEVRILYSSTASEGKSSYLDRDVRAGHTYDYRLTVTTALGDEAVSAWASVDIPSIANVTALDQNAPNPFNPLTTFSYSLAEPAHVRIVIYDARGAVVAALDQGTQPAGKHKAAWAGHNMSGNPAASGVYFYRLVGAGEVPARKMILLK